jgi:two-component system, NtrC family, sensor kinase
MTRLGLRAKLLIGMFLILAISIGLVAGQAVLLFQEDKSSYVFDLNASQAIRIADEIQSNVRHLTEKMQIFSTAIVLKAPEGVDQMQVLRGMLKQYPEFLLFSKRYPDGTLQEIFKSPALKSAGLSAEMLHAAYKAGAIPFDRVGVDRPFVTHLDLSKTMPTFTLAVAAPPNPDGTPGPVLIAECPLARLYGAGGEMRLYEIYVTDVQGEAFLSFAGGKAAVPATGGAGATFADLIPKTARTAGTRQYDASGTAMLAAYAPVGDLGLWTVVQIPRARAFEAAHRLVVRSLLIAGAVCLAGVGLVLLFASSITRSLVALTRATEQIGRGQFDIQIPVSGRDEIGALGQRFKTMTEELAARETALKDANVRLMESEKMTALGQLGAGIAHEVKNPLTSIRGYAQMGLRKLPTDNPLHDYFQVIEKETGRSLEILKNLLKFSRQETAEMSRIDLNVVVTDTVKLVTHQLAMKKVEVSSHLCDGTLEVMGNGNQVEQVLLNLFMNAGDAMEATGGSVSITTEAVLGGARIQVADTGPGMPEEVRKKVFNPFFTTKAIGKGTGLGLSVSYGIIKEHKGEVSVESHPGKGTVFTIQIPLAPAQAEDEPRVAVGGEKRVRVISLR